MNSLNQAHTLNGMDVPAIVDILGRDSDKLLVGRVWIVWFWQRKIIFPMTGMS